MIRSTVRPKRWTGPVLLLCAVVTLMVCLHNCSHHQANHFARPLAHSGGDTIDVAIEMSPTCYFVRGDSIFGDAYDHLQAISRRHGLHLKFHPFVPLDFALDGLDRGVFDIVVGSLPATAEMRDRYLTTNPLTTDREVLVQLRDSSGYGPLREPSALAGQEVWIASSDSPFARRLHNLSLEIGDTIYVRSDPRLSSELLVILTAKGEVPRAVVNQSLAARMQSRYPELDMSVAVSFTQFQSWLLRRGNEPLRDSLNLWISENYD